MRTRRSSALALAVASLVGCNASTNVHWRSSEPRHTIAVAPRLATAPGWQDLGRVPFETRPQWGGVVAWTGRSLLWWGGVATRDFTRVVVGGTTRPRYESPAMAEHAPVEGIMTGVGLDLATRRWWRIPRPPVRIPLLFAAGVWDGSELIIVGEECWAPTLQSTCFPARLVALAYDPARNRWARLPSPPARDNAHEGLPSYAIGWTGRLAVFDIGSMLAWEPRSQRWIKVGVPSETPQICTTAGYLVTATDEHASSMQFAARSDRPGSRWSMSSTLSMANTTNRLVCTARGAALLRADGRTGDGTAVEIDPRTLRVTKRAVPGAWLRDMSSFVPLAPDVGNNIELPPGTSVAFDAGHRVVALSDRHGLHVMILLRH